MTSEALSPTLGKGHRGQAKLILRRKVRDLSGEVGLDSHFLVPLVRSYCILKFSSLQASSLDWLV